jgi:hypothetical protein
MTTASEIVQAIRNGDIDAQLPAVIGAMHARQDYLRRQKGAENILNMPAGTRVIITDGIRPKYLVDILGKVTVGEYKPGYIWVEVDDRWKHSLRGRYNSPLHVPASCLRLAGEDEE